VPKLNLARANMLVCRCANSRSFGDDADCFKFLLVVQSFMYLFVVLNRRC
jgi:hypothetical protein